MPLMSLRITSRTVVLIISHHLRLRLMMVQEMGFHSHLPYPQLMKTLQLSSRMVKDVEIPAHKKHQPPSQHRREITAESRSHRNPGKHLQQLQPTILMEMKNHPLSREI